jgi:tetratricopeptide (TPR) repeat protein
VGSPHFARLWGKAQLELCRSAEKLANPSGQRRYSLNPQAQSLWLPAIQGQVVLTRKAPIEAIEHLQRASPPIEYGQIYFINQISCLYSTYLRGQAYQGAGQGKEAAAEFQKILDQSGVVWNCWTGALARLGVARANPFQAKKSTGADADAARVRALAAYKDFLPLWKDADPDIPVYKNAKAEYAKVAVAGNLLELASSCSFALGASDGNRMLKIASGLLAGLGSRREVNPLSEDDWKKFPVSVGPGERHPKEAVFPLTVCPTFAHHVPTTSEVTG